MVVNSAKKLIKKITKFEIKCHHTRFKEYKKKNKLIA